MKQAMAGLDIVFVNLADDLEAMDKNMMKVSVTWGRLSFCGKKEKYLN
jgi:hypothetical protein